MKIIKKIIPYIFSWVSLGFVIYVVTKAIQHTISK